MAKKSFTSKCKQLYIHISCVLFALDGPRPPALSQKPSLEPSEGDQVTLMCHSDANPPAMYSWFKGNQTLRHEHELVLHSVQLSDSREYFCKAKNLLGESTSRIWIDKTRETLI